MLEFLKRLKDDPDGPYDAIFFLPGDTKEQLHLEGARYTNPGVKLGSSSLGDAYHVILFKEDNDVDGIYDIDVFDAIFIEPYEYISGLIPASWYGILAKKTTTSNGFVNKLLDNLKNQC
jgi:hypothetical protein